MKKKIEIMRKGPRIALVLWDNSDFKIVRGQIYIFFFFFFYFKLTFFKLLYYFFYFSDNEDTCDLEVT